MRPFVFRAAAALDLRRRQDDEAQRERAAAEARRRAAEQQLETTTAALHATFARAQQAEAGGDLTVRVWYRNWIAGQRLQIERCTAAVEQREREVQDATARATVAHRKRKALERFHDRALATWHDAARREEQQVIDELATMRHARERAGGSQ